MKAKPTVPNHNEGAMQRYYLERISKCQRPDYFGLAQKKKHMSVLPTILNQSEVSYEKTTSLDRIPSYRKYLHKVDSLVGPI